MKRIKRFIFSTVIAISAICGITSCNKTDNSNTLYLFNWTYYTPASVIEKFEQEYNCKVKIDTFDSNEVMYAN